MPNSDFHNRYHEALRKYWDTLRGERPYPAEDEINTDAIADLWPSFFLISIDDVTRRLGYRYSYLGDELIEAFGDDSGDPDIAMKLVATTNQALIQKFNQLVHDGKPMMDDSEFKNLKHLHVKYRTCALPLGKDGAVTHILGVMRWRIY